MKKVIIISALLVSSVFATEVYQKCAACHGANGEKAALGKSKIIKDMTKAEIVTAMKGYKDGTYGGPMKGLMKGQANPLSDADIEAIANFIGK